MSLPARVLQGAALVIALTTVAGCGGGSDSDGPSAASPLPSGTATDVTVSPSTAPSSTATPTKTPTAPKVDCAKIFTQQGAEALAGEALGRPKSEAVSSLPGCRWTSSKTGAWVQALAVPASRWAQAVPEAVETALASGLEFEGRDQLEEARRLIEEGGKLDNAAACGVFSTLASALQGQPVGTTKVFNYVPNKEAAQAINEQACLNGRYYSVQLVSPRLKPGPALEKRIRQALAELSR